MATGSSILAEILTIFPIILTNDEFSHHSCWKEDADFLIGISLRIEPSIQTLAEYLALQQPIRGGKTEIEILFIVIYPEARSGVFIVIQSAVFPFRIDSIDCNLTVKPFAFQSWFIAPGK